MLRGLYARVCLCYEREGLFVEVEKDITKEVT